MIVWLASYPRSGNTLVRTILKSCFDFHSFDSELPPSAGYPNVIATALGHMEPDAEWSTFLERASHSPDRHFIKTHHPPKDDQPCIYIVRDGRKAVLSYYYHFQQFFPDEKRSLLDLVLGHDYYGDWTSHYRSWDPKRRPRTLLLSYEALLNNPAAEIARIAEFLNLGAPLHVWRNPFALLQQQDSEFFRKGTAHWEPDPLWTRQIDAVFRLKHGDLMAELGYPAPDSTDFVDSGVADQHFFILDVVQFAARVLQAAAQSDEVAANRLDEINRIKEEAEHRRVLIEKLHSGIQNMIADANERLEMALYWQSVAIERLQEINNLASEAEKRRVLIEKLHGDLQRIRVLSQWRLPSALGHL